MSQLCVAHLLFCNVEFGLVGQVYGLQLFAYLVLPLHQDSSLRLDVAYLNSDVRYTAQPAIDIQWSCSSIPRMRLVGRTTLRSAGRFQGFFDEK
jgi:hypothetical protein